MVWHLIKPLIAELSKPFRDASLELLKVEKGVETGAPPWKSCVTKTNSVMGFATGYLYIKERAGKNAKQHVRTWEKVLNLLSKLSHYSHFKYKTRQRDDIHLPNPKLTFEKNTFRFSGAVLFNHLPTSGKEATTLSFFKNSLRFHFSHWFSTKVILRYTLIALFYWANLEILYFIDMRFPFYSMFMLLVHN